MLPVIVTSCVDTVVITRRARTSTSVQALHALPGFQVSLSRKTSKVFPVDGPLLPVRRVLKPKQVHESVAGERNQTIQVRKQGRRGKDVLISVLKSCVWLQMTRITDLMTFALCGACVTGVKMSLNEHLEFQAIID